MMMVGFLQVSLYTFGHFRLVHALRFFSATDFSFDDVDRFKSKLDPYH